MAHDVFVSYSSQDKPTADAIVASLEANGIRCWIAPRDILPGSDWSESIVEAMELAGTMVLVFSAHSNSSPQIRREIESAVSAGIPVIPFRIEDVLPSKSLQYFIGPQHWLDAWTPPLEQHLHRLTDTIKALLSKRVEGFDAAGKEPRLKPQTDTAVGGLTPESAEIPLTPAREELLAGISKSTPARKLSRTIPLILVVFLVAAALGGGMVWWLHYQPGGPKIAGKTLVQSNNEPALPLRAGPAKGSSPQVEEQPGTPATPSVEKMSAEDYFSKGQEAKDPEEKIVFYNKAIELNPKYAEAFNYRGNAYFDKKNYEMALNDYNNAILLNPNWANPYSNRGRYYLVVKKDYDRATKEFDMAISLNPKDGRFYSNRGVVYIKQNKLEAALKDYNTAIELNPNDALAYNSRGYIYLEKKDYAKALQEYNKAIELDPSFVTGYYNRATLYKKKKEIDKALQEYSKIIKVSPNDAVAYNNRCAMYCEKKNYDKALDDCEKAIELDSNNAHAYVNRGNINLAQKKYDEALQDYDKAIELDPNNHVAYMNRGIFYYEKKLYEKAFHNINKAIDLDPNNQYYHLRRKMLYKRFR